MMRHIITRPSERRHVRSQRGSSLILVLFLVMTVSTIITAVLGMSLTSARVGISAEQERIDSYAATSAIDAAIQHGRTAKWVGRYGLACPTVTVTVAGPAASVSCVSSTGPYDIDRTLTYAASVNGTRLVEAQVVIRDSTANGGEPTVDVLSWRSLRA